MAHNSTAEIAVALDNITVNELPELIDELSHAGVKWLKVGLELFTKGGLSLVKNLKGKGFHVFLDLKLYDIPNTVSNTVSAISSEGVDLLTLHCLGGIRMLEAAAKSSEGTPLKLVGVTLLTSYEAEELNTISNAWALDSATKFSRSYSVLNLATLAAQSGISGIVSAVSDLDAEGFALKLLPWRAKPFFVTPGIREVGDSVGDQRQTATVEQAMTAGSTLLVVGRPITSKSVGRRGDAAARFLKAIQGVSL